MVQALSQKGTYIKVKASAYRLATSFDKVAGALSDAVKRLRLDNVGVGVAVGEDTFPPCVLRAKCQGSRASMLNLHLKRGAHIVLVQSRKHGSSPLH